MPSELNIPNRQAIMSGCEVNEMHHVFDESDLLRLGNYSLLGFPDEQEELRNTFAA